MNRNPLRLIAYISLFLVIASLILFTNLEENMIISIALILIFLMIFTYIFKIEGPKTLKVIIILFTFIGLPLFLIFYLNLFNSLIASILAGVMAIICGIASIITIIKLDDVEIVFE